MQDRGEVLEKSNSISYPLLNSRNNTSTRSVDKIGKDDSCHMVTEYGVTDTMESSRCYIYDRDQLIKWNQCQDTQQPGESILNQLPAVILEEIFQYVDQFDLVRLSQVCHKFYPLATSRLYKRVTVILNAEFPSRYKNDSTRFIQHNGIKYMDTALILNSDKLLVFLDRLKNNYHLVQRVKFFVFDKCHSNFKLDSLQISVLQNQIIDFFGACSNEINFLHITFIDFLLGIEKLTSFLRNENVRQRIFKLFVTSLPDLYQPVTPQGLTNLFLMLDEVELMKYDSIDLSTEPFNLFNSLFTLTCSTSDQFGLEILNKFKLVNGDSKLKLKGFTVFHCHKETLLSEDNNLHHDIFAHANSYEPHRQPSTGLDQYVRSIGKTLNFKVMDDKIDLTYLSNLYLKIDCNEHRSSTCQCFPNFFKDLTNFVDKHQGLTNLTSFELELFPNLEWLRPHQLLENILTPLGNFVKSLSNLTRLTIDFSTPGFKMFDNSMGMDSLILNRLNERLMEAFFLCFLSSNGTQTVMNLKTLQLPDFLTSFIYYKPDFYESLLHTCKCWGCHLVLERLKESFYPLTEDDDDENDMDLQSTYYILIGFILGKLQADREVCVPIKQKTFRYRNYPIYKGQPHTLHSHFHKEYHRDCKCNLDADPDGKDDCNIDNLVTIYIVHQLRPITAYLSMIFFKLDILMIHGIYYEFVAGELVPIYDANEYPDSFVKYPGKVPAIPFGKFRIP